MPRPASSRFIAYSSDPFATRFSYMNLSYGVLSIHFCLPPLPCFVRKGPCISNVTVLTLSDLHFFILVSRL